MKNKHKDNPPSLQDALAHHQAGRLQQAEAIYIQLPDNPDALHLLGVIASQTGHFALAIERIEQALRLNPDNASYYCNLGGAYQSLRRLDEAVVCYRQALARNPDYVLVLNNLGNALKEMGQGDQAVTSYQRALALKPDYVEALSNLGATLTHQGKLDEAIASYRKAIALKPELYEAHFNCGNALCTQGKLDEAAACFLQAIAVNPHFADAHNNLGGVLRDQGKLDEAFNSFKNALAIHPEFSDAHNNLGIACRAMGRLDDAVICFQNALQINPIFIDAHNNLGITFKDQGKLADAVHCFQRLLEIAPQSHATHNNLGTVLQSQGKLDDAVNSFRQALACQADFTDAHNNLGIALKEQGKLDEAMACFRQALAIDPHFTTAHSNLLFCHNYHPTLSAEKIYTAYQDWNARQAAQFAAAIAPHANTKNPQRRLKIGYLSPDFRHHSVIHFAAPLIEGHDKAQVEVFCYYSHYLHDDFTTRIMAAADHWIPCSTMSDDLLAQRIRDDGIDILVDLAGHTAGNRLLVFARKPAPVQVSWLGFGYTTGLAAMDYFIGDAVFTPPGCEALFSESLVRLPHCFTAFRPLDAAPAINASPAQRNGYATFACLSRSERINDRVIETWAVLLHRLPTARLRLDSKTFNDAQQCQLITNKFAAHGIPASQLQLGFTSPVWQVYQEVDIALDCFPHNSGTTTYEALWMGVPVITLADRPSVGRLGASILSCLGKKEWIACDENDYVERAAILAEDLIALKKNRASLRMVMHDSPLLDQARFVKDMEVAYQEMWRTWCAATSAHAPL